MTTTPADTTQQRKSTLRKQVLGTLAALPEVTRATASQAACERLKRQQAWTEAESILFYAPIRSELNVWPLVGEALSQGKHLLLPRFEVDSESYKACRITDLSKDILHGHFGIREAAAHCASLPLNRLDLALVPGVAFDLHGRRLGRGKGFYDRLLPAVRGIRCGVAFDEQLLSEVPVEPHDIFLNCILTPTRWIEL